MSRSPDDSTGYQMIRQIEIKRFRCFRHLVIPDIKRLNIIVGDNGSGKTSLLEALFLTLASSTEVSARLRALRGLDSAFSGSQGQIAEAIWGDFFHNNDSTQPISIALDGDGEDNRSLTISKGSADTRLPLPGHAEATSRIAPIIFQWRNRLGQLLEARPEFLRGGQVNLPETGEHLADFFHYASNQVTSSVEVATRFSELSKKNQHRDFVHQFTREYDWIEDLNVEVQGGMPTLYATVRGGENKLPLANVSGGINRIVAITLAIASRTKAVISVDEIENGLFHAHQQSIWRSLLTLVRRYDSQLFISTHSQEWLEALLEATGDNVSDIALWRLERTSERQPTLRQFSGETLKAGLASGAEIR